MNKIITILILIFISINLEINAQNELIFNDIIKQKRIVYDKDNFWEFDKTDKLKFSIEKIDSINQNSNTKLMSYLVKFQFLTSNKNPSLKSAEGTLKLDYINNEINSKVPLKVIQIETNNLSISDYNNILEFDKFWRNFFTDFKKDNKESIVKNYFEYPIKSYSSKIENHQKLLNSYFVYFSLLKKSSNKNLIFSFPAKKANSQCGIGESFIEIIEINNDNEENPMNSLKLVAKKFGKEVKFFSIELGS